ncbi:MAG: HoxN/HupN/NixA family nickel/cobalt transporter [Alicyclobacillus sp.]|nr:HoxN/HupN/NixA family nickel/cobalt transporter [Alicyclobacillus sp.]
MSGRWTEVWQKVPDARALRRLYGGLGLLHIGAFGALALAALRAPGLVTLGVLAYTAGLRHAVDADHIAAIDNSTRKLVHEGQRPLTTGLYFALGHASVVLLLTLVVAGVARSLAARLPAWSGAGALGTVVSAGFLYLMAAFNASVLLDLWRARRHGAAATAAANGGLPGGLATRLYRRVFNLVRRPWHMFGVGFLFGLGFETATEIALLGVSASAAAHGVSAWGVLVLPVLFAAGMSLVDTTDGVLMLCAYRWALQDPQRRLAYNLAVTGLSVAIALGVGTLEWLQLAVASWAHGGAWAWLAQLDLGVVGYGAVAVLTATWLVAAAWQRWLGRHQPETEGMAE